MPRLVPPVIAVGSIAGREQPRVATGTVTLRRWETADHQALIDAYADSAIQRWHAMRIDSVAEANEWIAETWGGWQSESVATWAITVGDGPRPVGRASLYFHDLRNGLAEAVYWVVPQARGAGVATSALVAMSTWAFDELGMHRIEVQHSVANPTSCRVATKADFEAEGTRSSAQLHGDGWHDMHVHRRIATT